MLLHAMLRLYRYDQTESKRSPRFLHTNLNAVPFVQSMFISKQPRTDSTDVSCELARNGRTTSCVLGGVPVFVCVRAKLIDPKTHHELI